MYRKVPGNLSGHIQLAMMHHSLEHTLDPVAALKEAADVLAPDGIVAVRIPLADSFAWRHYGPDWTVLDPPRHTFLLTEHSIELAARAAGSTQGVGPMTWSPAAAATAALYETVLRSRRAQA